MSFRLLAKISYDFLFGSYSLAPVKTLVLISKVYVRSGAWGLLFWWVAWELTYIQLSKNIHIFGSFDLTYFFNARFFLKSSEVIVTYIIYNIYIYKLYNN